MKARSAVSRRERQRAAKGPVLVRCADRLNGKKQRGRILRQQRAHAREISLRDIGIDADRQMRAMLLDRGDGQHRDAGRVEFLVVKESQSATRSVVVPCAK